jgi:proteasome-associated ATPase
VLFFDEADALFKRRPADAREGAFTLVPSLLAEMDGLEENAAFVILATNRPDALDEAITRPGRIDRRIRVTRPNEGASQVIFRIHLEGVFLAEGLSVEELSAAAAAELFLDQHLLYELSFEDAEEPVAFRLRDLASGALIQNIVDRATANKMEYCIQHGVKTGLTRDDMREAVAESLDEQRAARHVEEITEFAEVNGYGRLVESRRVGR